MATRTAPARDRFDDVPADLGRIGAHRAPVKRRGFAVFAWAALATGALVGVGVLGLGTIESRIAAGIGGSSTSTSASTSVSAKPAPTIDADAQVVMLNGTTTTGLAAAAAKTAKGDGWTVTSTANADQQDVKLSTVYYGEDSQLGAAEGLAKSLGIGRTAQSDQFDVQGRSRLTVVLGADYAKAA